jgi:predicted hydrocarbon binding protein
MSDIVEKQGKIQEKIQGLMIFFVALSDGLESTAGRGAEATCFRSGRKLGLEWQVKGKTRDISLALKRVAVELERMGIDWPFEVKYSLQSFPGYQEIKLPFQNCVVRCSLFRYGFPQGKALCQTKHGLFCGLFEKIYGKKANLDIFKRGQNKAGAGENACLLILTINND